MLALLTPKWVAGHLLVLLVGVAFVNLGLWQLDRHQWRAERNVRIAAGLAQPPVPFDQTPPGRRAYRPVVASGRYVQDADVLLSPRNERGPGHHVLTPFITEAGETLLVDRGWVPFRFHAPPVPGARAPAGEVVLRGVLLPAAEAEAQGVREDGRLVRVRAVDPALILKEQRATQRPVADVFFVARGPQPVSAALPVPGPLPEQDPGPHLSYAIQWFLFTAVLLVGYPLLLRRTVMDADRGGPDETDLAGFLHDDSETTPP